MEYYQIDATFNKNPSQKDNDGDDRYTAAQAAAFKNCPCTNCPRREGCTTHCEAFRAYVN